MEWNPLLETIGREWDRATACSVSTNAQARFWIADCGFWIENAGLCASSNPKSKIRDPKSTTCGRPDDVRTPFPYHCARKKRAMKFGICTSWTSAKAVQSAGWDYIEESVQAVLQGTVDDANWTEGAKITASVLPIPVANMLVPAAIRITGPAVDLSALQKYMTRVLSRADIVGMKTLVFGSGGARNIPDGFDRSAAFNQIVEFLRISAP